MGFCAAFQTVVMGITTTLSHDTLSDNQRRPFLFCYGIVQSLPYLVDIITIYRYHVPIPSTILHCGVFIRHRVALCRQLDIVGVIEHNQVVELQEAGNTTCTLRYFLLNAAVTNIRVYLLLIERVVAKMGSKELGRNCRTDCIAMPLAERP